jgi:uncharacterized protein YxeA
MQTKDIIKEWAGNKDRLFTHKIYSSSKASYVVITDVMYKKEKNGRVTTLFEYEEIYTHALEWNGEETEFHRSFRQWSKARYFELAYKPTWQAHYAHESERKSERGIREAEAQAKRDELDGLMKDLSIGIRYSREFRRGHDFNHHHYEWEIKEYRKDGEDGVDGLIATLRDAKKFYELIASGAITLPDMEEQEVA